MISGKIENNFKQQRVTMFIEARNHFVSYDAGNKDNNITSPCAQLKMFKQIIDGTEYVVFGVHVDEQSKLNFDDVRAVIAAEMGASPTTQFSQFVGDSNLYTNDGTRFGKKLVASTMASNDDIVLYGYTGKTLESDNESRRDVNQLLSDWVDAKDEGKSRSARVLANIVDEHTNVAIEKWGCSISQNVRFFYLVYSNTPTPSVKFGSDTISSDSITNRQTICLDGGIQSLRQSIFMLNRNVAINGVTGLRDLTSTEDDRYFNQGSPNLPYLSAVEFLQHMKNMMMQYQGELTEAAMVEIRDQYLKTHALFNEKKLDAGTKLPLWNIAWGEFLKLDLKILELFTSTNCHESALVRANSTRMLFGPLTHSSLVKKDETNLELRK